LAPAARFHKNNRQAGPTNLPQIGLPLLPLLPLPIIFRHLLAAAHLHPNFRCSAFDHFSFISSPIKPTYSILRLLANCFVRRRPIRLESHGAHIPHLISPSLSVSRPVPREPPSNVQTDQIEQMANTLMFNPPPLLASFAKFHFPINSIHFFRRSTSSLAATKSSGSTLKSFANYPLNLFYQLPLSLVGTEPTLKSSNKAHRNAPPDHHLYK